MSGKFKHTSQRVLAKQVLEMIDWQLERTEQQKMVDNMLGAIEQNMGKRPATRAINTMQVVRLREDALQAARNHVGSASNVSGIGSSFKKLNSHHA